MQVDLVAGSRYEAHHSTLAERMATRPKILVFDSGLGGLTVFAEVARLRPDAALTYAADDAGFPYGRWGAADLVEQVGAVMQRLIARVCPDVVVIACNTASTLVLPHLRALYPDLPFIGTVPAIKPAAAVSRSRIVSVLATPGTVVRDYTRALIETYAADCQVTLVGSKTLAGLAEAAMKGEAVDDGDLAREIAPCFVTAAGARTDCVVLACTHYPLLLARFEALAPWPVIWIDPAPAIARRVDHVLRERGFETPTASTPDEDAYPAIFTSAQAPGAALAECLRQRGLAACLAGPLPV